MHQGTFPPSDPQTPNYQPAHKREELEPIAPAASRRQWLFALGGIFVGLTVPASWSVVAGDRKVSVPAETQPSTPQWALDLVEQPSETVLKWAGDLEQVAARHRTDVRLIPSFERLLEVVLDQRGPTVDAAGGYAIRGLERLGAGDIVAANQRKIIARRDLAETRRAMEQVLGSAWAPDSKK